MISQINGIGKQKIKYKDHSNMSFDTLDNYLHMAKKAISKFANKIFSGLSKNMLKDEDALSHVATAMMMADWRWDDNYESKTGTRKTKYSYRNQCALWAIQTYASKDKNKKASYSLNHEISNEDTSDMYSFIEDKRFVDPYIQIEANEYQENLSSIIKELISSERLSDRERDYINLYYFEGETFEKIGKRYGITREAVRQGLNKAIKLIRSCANV
jgi:RNA polymerase sigma factor (sigma-70 family)